MAQKDCGPENGSGSSGLSKTFLKFDSKSINGGVTIRVTCVNCHSQGTELLIEQGNVEVEAPTNVLANDITGNTAEIEQNCNIKNKSDVEFGKPPKLTTKMSVAFPEDHKPVETKNVAEGSKAQEENSLNIAKSEAGPKLLGTGGKRKNKIEKVPSDDVRFSPADMYVLDRLRRSLTRLHKPELFVPTYETLSGLKRKKCKAQIRKYIDYKNSDSEDEI